VLFEVTKDSVVLRATDTQGLIETKLSFAQVSSFPADKDKSFCILHGKTLASILNKVKCELVGIDLINTFAYCNAIEVPIVSEAEGLFPSFEGLKSNLKDRWKAQTIVSVNVKDFAEQLNKLARLQAKPITSVTMITSSDSTISLGTYLDASENHVEWSKMDANTSTLGDQIKIAFNAKFMLGLLKSVSAPRVTLKLSEKFNPMEVIGNPNSFMLLSATNEGIKGV
jgi:DNA polymerase III sliding clamp (beta) subunit (PCNA family)